MSAAGKLSLAFLVRHPRRAAKRLGAVAPETAARLLETCPVESAAEALQHVDPVHAGQVLDALPRARRRSLMIALPPKRAALLLQDADPARRAAWLEELPDELKRSLRTALASEADSVARWMDPAVLAAPVEMNAGEARALVARHAQRALYYLYVIDADRHPVGVLNLRELMGAAAPTPLSALMHAPVVSLSARASTAAAAIHPGWRNLHALPVVDEHGVLVGVVRYETAEILRGRTDEDRDAGGIGVALSEALWTVSAHVVDEVAAAVRSRENRDD